MTLLEKIMKKDNGYELASIGIGFDLTGDCPTNFVAELDKYYGDEPNTFEEAVEPLMKWLSDNHHPHVSVIVTSGNAEMVEGLKNHITDKFIKDGSHEKTSR